MLSRIKAIFDADFFDINNGNSSPELGQDDIQLACAALLIEVAMIDQEFDQSEFDAMQNILMQQFGITQEECQTITELAQRESENATSTYQFTQKVNNLCSYEDKFTLVKNMWSIAYADGNLDKYEEYIIRKTAELLHLSHNDFIRAKHAVRPDA